MTLVFYDDGERKYRDVVDTTATVYCTYYRGGGKRLGLGIKRADTIWLCMMKMMKQLDYLSWLSEFECALFSFAVGGCRLLLLLFSSALL